MKPELPLIDIPKPAIPEITVNPGTPMPEETVTHTLKVNVDDVLTPAVMERFYRRKSHPSATFGNGCESWLVNATNLFVDRVS